MARDAQSKSKPTLPAKKKRKPLMPKKDRIDFFRYCILGKFEQARFMLMYNFDPNITDELGNTPLMRAIEYGHLDIVKSLLAHGAKVTAKNDAGWTPLQFAIYYDRPKIELLLRNYGALI